MIARCPECDEPHRVPDDSVGRKFKCSSCGTIVTVEPPPHAERKRKRSGLTEQSVVQEWAVFLLVLSAADLFMTYTLLRTHPRFFESNPIAQWFFARWNIAGMVLFKFGMVGIVIALGEFIERRAPGRGKFVLMVGCVASCYAVVKGLRLYLEHAP